MRLLASAFCFASVAAWTPPRVSHRDLVHSHGAGLLEALSATGLVAITDIPQCKFHKTKTLKSLVDCASSRASKLFVTAVLPDGTERRTVATHKKEDTTPLFSQDEEPSKDCAPLQDNAIEFRKTVSQVTKMIAKVLDEAMPASGGPYLQTSEDSGKKYDSLERIFADGDHLEHFHVYYPSSNGDHKTLDWHIDQGLALIFTPGQFVQDKEAPTGGFYIQLADGTETQVDFEPQDDLVLMLGDGVNKFINPRLTSSKLRAVPHALDLSSIGGNTRAWYGRMVLAPVHVLDPPSNDETTTVGDVRHQQGMHQQQQVLSNGIRYLEDATAADCMEDDLFYCWHRCFNLTDVTSETCAEGGFDLTCANSMMQLWDNVTHNPDFQPRCLDASTAETFATPTPTSAPTGEGSTEDEANGTSGAMVCNILWMALALVAAVAMVWM